jgi:hypothetical protein
MNWNLSFPLLADLTHSLSSDLAVGLQGGEDNVHQPEGH